MIALWFKKVRIYEIRLRRAVQGLMQGNFHSIFKGDGLQFDDVRSYQYGDDIRTIDWNVSAKGHGLFVKTFKEERNQSVFFLIDISSSSLVGAPARSKQDLVLELAGVLSLSAIKEGSQVGYLSFSSGKERYMRPGRGMRYAYAMLKSLVTQLPSGQGTDLAAAALFATRVLKRKSVVIVISDFIAPDYALALKALALRHELILIHVFDPKEERLPAVGIIPIIDREQGRRKWLNTSSPRVRAELRAAFVQRLKGLRDFAKKEDLSFLSIHTDQDLVLPLSKLFRQRKHSQRSTPRQ